MTVRDVEQQLSNVQYTSLQPVPIATGVPETDIVYIRRAHREFPGVAVTFTAERTYPHPDLAAHVLGYVGDITPAELAASRQLDDSTSAICNAHAKPTGVTPRATSTVRPASKSPSRRGCTEARE